MGMLDGEPGRGAEVLFETERLVLRRFTPGDVELLVELDSDPEVMRHINGGPPTSREQVQGDIIPRWMAMYAAGLGRGFWAACAREDGRFLGWFHLKQGYYWPDELEVGYRLRRAEWGKGVASEGTCGLIAHAFETLGERRVIACTLVANVGSRRVMEKCGMVFEREFVEQRFPGADKRAVKYVIDQT